MLSVRVPGGTRSGRSSAAVVHREGARGGEERPAADVAPGPDHGRQARDRPHRHAAPGVPVQAVVEADRRRPRRRVLAGERLDLLRPQAGRRRRPRGRPLLRPLAQLLVADRVALEPVPVLEPVAEDDVHHPEREGGVRARVRREVQVGLLGGARAERVDAHEPRPSPPRLLDEGPQVHVRADDVRAPGHDEARVDDGLGVEAHRLPDGGLEAVAPRRRADGPVEEARPERVEEAPVHAAVAEEAHVAGVRVGQDRPAARARRRPPASAPRPCRAPRPRRSARSGPRPSCPPASSGGARGRGCRRGPR